MNTSDEPLDLRQVTWLLEQVVAQLKRPSVDKLAYTKAEFAKATGVGIKKVEDALHREELKGFLWGGLWMIPVAEAHHWMARRLAAQYGVDTDQVAA